MLGLLGRHPASTTRPRAQMSPSLTEPSPPALLIGQRSIVSAAHLLPAAAVTMRPVRAMPMTLSAKIFTQHDISSFNDKSPPLTQGCSNLPARFAKNAAQRRGGNIHNRRGLLLRHAFRIDQPQGFQHIQSDTIFPFRNAVLRAIAAAGRKDADPTGFARPHASPSFLL